MFAISFSVALPGYLLLRLIILRALNLFFYAQFRDFLWHYAASEPKDMNPSQWTLFIELTLELKMYVFLFCCVRMIVSTQSVQFDIWS